MSDWNFYDREEPCDVCHQAGLETAFVSYDNGIVPKRYDSVCRECFHKFEESVGDTFKRKAVQKEECTVLTRAAMFHLAVMVAWGPLSWVVCHEVINFYYHDYHYINQIKWGVASSGVMLNLHLFFEKMIRAGHFKFS